MSVWIIIKSPPYALHRLPTVAELQPIRPGSDDGIESFSHAYHITLDKATGVDADAPEWPHRERMADHHDSW